MSRTPKRFLARIREAKEKQLEKLDLSGLGVPGNQRLIDDFVDKRQFLQEGDQMASGRQSHPQTFPSSANSWWSV
jgi:hypothetical protein